MSHPTPMRGRTQPIRAEVLALPQLHLPESALLTSLLATLRDSRTPGPFFAQTAAEISRFVLWQALRDARLVPVTVPGHDGQAIETGRLAPGIAAVAVLRAGLAMVPPLRRLAPDAPVYQIGVHRDEATLAPSVYYSNLPAALPAVAQLLILDPMLATAGSALTAIERVRAIPDFRGRLCYLGLIGAPLGVRRLVEREPAIAIYLAALDERLDERGFIVPGLGDAGDRIFGTG